MKNKSFLIILIILIIIIFLSLIIITKNNKINNKSIFVNNATLSNKKIGWGIKRANDNNQPSLGTQNKELIDRFQGIAMGNNQSKKVYLTFDEGYEAGYTSKILEVLKQNEIKATFFITAHYLNTNSELVKQMIDEGHIIGNHTVNHYSMPDLTDEKLKEEIMKLHTAVYEKFGIEMKYIRPPMGEMSERTLEITNSLGYTTVMWSFAYDDWDKEKQGREEYAKKTILSNIHNGAVILLHACSIDNSNILDTCIKQIKDMGYQFEGLDNFER